MPESDVAAIARLSFDYDGARIGCGDRKREITRIEGEQIVSIARKKSAETGFRRRLEDLGFERVDGHWASTR